MPTYKLTSFDLPGFGHELVIPQRAPKTPSGLLETHNTRPQAPFYMKQVHGGTVHFIWESDSIPPWGVFGDGVFTNISRLPLMIFTADCIPLIIASDNPRFIGVIHASWRSVSLGIIENAVALLTEELRARTAKYRCFMGPAILREDYEVGRQVAERFPQSISPKPDGKFLLDLPGEVIGRLIKAGIRKENIVSPPLSTLQEIWLPSYRREGDSTARIETVVWLE